MAPGNGEVSGKDRSLLHVWRARNPKTLREVRVVSFATYITGMLGVAGIAGAVISGVYGMTRGAEQERQELRNSLRIEWTTVLNEKERTAGVTHDRLDSRINGVESKVDKLETRFNNHVDERGNSR